jgi:Tol biopolymer transport system component
VFALAVRTYRRAARPATLIAALTLALAWLAAGSVPARAAFTGRNGLVVYQGAASARGVFLARPSRGSVRRLFAAPSPVSDPAISPRGKRVAFIRGGAIWVMGLDGSGLRQVTLPPVPEGEPAWSPAGDAIVFAAGAPGAQRIFTVGADGAGLRQITAAGPDDRSPAWSSRGAIAFARRTRHSGYDLFTTTPLGGVPRRLTRARQDDLWPNWSPDGRRLAFVSGRQRRRDVFVMDADGRHLRRLTRLRSTIASPTWSPDGKRIAFARGASGHRALWVVSVRRGRGLKRLTTTRADASSPDWQPTGSDPVIAAAGDIACDPADAGFNNGLGTARRCQQLATSNLLLDRDLDGVLVLGDNQYEDGTLAKHMASFAPTWGRLGSLLHPVPGNHEYRDPGAAGYWDYFNGPGRPNGVAGPTGLGYYSFDIGRWHIVAINSECVNTEATPNPMPGGCAPGSAQEQFVRADLAAHRNACTLAFWHHPAFTSGLEGPSPGMDAMWQALYDNGADIVLNGHAHLYERLALQTPQGTPDPARGIREFVVGTGGKSHQGLRVLAANSQVRNTSSYGVLQLTLHPRSYDWRFLPIPGQTFTDSGSSACH